MANKTEGDTGDQACTRLGFRRDLKCGDYGSFDYGRNYGVLYDVEGWTDMLPELGGDSYTQRRQLHDRPRERRRDLS